MKSRSHRLPINDQPDDWGDGSWTVDCICGVNYDDGEEMVNCDECGVWVHTRCSRFVKGETSFACDKCKRKKSRNDNEETEVAQLLVELPTKTITMNKQYMSAPAPPARSSLMLWTNIPPVEERVHVQGVPGGDPKLFQGVSAVFNPELWKCSRYVPKKFNFQYRGFPCWEENQEGKQVGVDIVSDGESDNPVDSGADALFSLSKEIVSASPVEMLVGLRGSVESGSREQNTAHKEGKKKGSEDSSARYVHNSGVKESNQFRHSGVNLGKRKDSLRSKDLSGKKKARSASKEVDGKRRVPGSAISGEKAEALELGETKIVATDFQDSKNKDKHTTLDHKTDNGPHTNTYKLKEHLAVSAHYARDSSRKDKSKDDLAANVHHTKETSKKANSRDKLEANVEDSSKKVKPKVSLEGKSHNADDSSKKGKKDKFFAKPNHADDFSKKVKSKDNLASNVYCGEDTSKETWGNSSLVEIVVKSEKAHEDRTRNGSSEAVTVEVSLLEPIGVNTVTKHEDPGGLDHLNDAKHDSCDLNVNLPSCALPSAKLKPPVTEVPKSRVQDSIENTSPVSLRPDIQVKTEANEGPTKVTSSAASSLMVDVKLDDTKSLDQHPSISVSEHPCESFHVYGTNKSNIPSDETAITESSAVSCCVKDNVVEGMIPVSGEPCQNKEVIGSAGTLSVQECSSDTKHLKCGEELSKTGGISPSISAPLPQRKVVIGFGKSSSTVLISKSEVSGGCKPSGRPASPSTLRPIHFTKRVKTTSTVDIMKDHTKPNSNVDTKKDDTVVDAIKDEHRQDEPKKTGGEQLKASTVSASKSSHMSRVCHASISKRSLTDSKEVVHYSYSKAPTAHNVTVCSGSIESISALQSQSVSQVLSKTTASDFSEKGEKFSPSGCHSSSKVTSSSMHPPAPVNSSSTLSDEELALLLHQELNSSPRVPRVPRVRHAGSIPQLASTTATSMLVKRTPSSGVKDHIWVSRRKNKEEAPKDVSHSSGELSDERKMGRVQSKDHRRQDEVLTSDSSTKKPLGGSPEVEHSAVKQTPLASSSTFGQSSSTEVIDQNLSSPHNSPRNTTDDEDDDDDDDVDADADADADEDDACGVAGPATRTLPGLLDEIMSKGKRMTYEELCNAVLPHWNNLRKHNGERYAYSSHSQAVLDCLRNRNEWARLVDRGPKTNAGRKKRRPDSEPPLVEPEENEYSKSRITKELVGKQFDAHTEDFPKGKRKARKRRRLALQGRGIRDVRKRQKTNAVTDEDLGPFSHSSDNGGAFSEDSQGARTRPNGSEVSGSSDEADQ